MILDYMNKMIYINTLTFDYSNINGSTSRQSARLFKIHKKSNAAMNTAWVSSVCILASNRLSVLAYVSVQYISYYFQMTLGLNELTFLSGG